MATPSMDNEELEAFGIAFDDDGNMVMGWGTTRVTLPISY
jgi:hypothetical protein